MINLSLQCFCMSLAKIQKVDQTRLAQGTMHKRKSANPNQSHQISPNFIVAGCFSK